MEAAGHWMGVAGVLTWSHPLRFCMRRLLERIFEDFTANARVLVAVGSATPFLIVYFVVHGLALRDEAIRQGLNAGPMLVLQAVFVVCSLVNLGIGLKLWPRRSVNEPADDPAQLACLSIGLAYTLLCMLTGTFTSGTNLILVGVLAIGLLLFLLARLDHLHENLTRLSYTDGLTGLANRRRFMDVLGAELARQARSG